MTRGRFPDRERGPDPASKKSKFDSGRFRAVRCAERMGVAICHLSACGVAWFLRDVTGVVTTIPNPPDQRGYQSGPHLVTALTVYGTGLEMQMLPTQSSYTFGRGELCDLRPVGPIENLLVSRVHARLDRVRASAVSNKDLRVTDISPGTNEIVIDKVVSKEFALGAGDSFYVGQTRYVAMTDQMRTSRNGLSEILGIGQHAIIDDLLIAAVQEPACHMVITGESGSDQIRIGAIVHDCSHRRHRRFHAVNEQGKFDSEIRQQLLDAACGTVLVPVFQRGKLDPRLVETLLEPKQDRRLIVCAPTHGKVSASFPPGSLPRAHEVKVPPLRERLTEIPQIVDQWLIHRYSPLLFSRLRSDLQSAQLNYTWPGNLAELREWVDMLHGLASYESRYELKNHNPSTESRLKRIEKDKLGLKVQFPLIPPSES